MSSKSPEQKTASPLSDLGRGSGCDRTFRIISSSLVSFTLALLISGCAVRYHDAATGTDHLWGFGHFAARATLPNEGRVAVVRGSDILGLGIDVSPARPQFVLGWSREIRVDVLSTDTAVELRHPENLFEIAVGSEPTTITRPEP